MTIHQALTGFLLLLAVPVAGCVTYLLVIAIASFFHRPGPAQRLPSWRLAVLVPAHNEAAWITRTVQSLLEQRYPRMLYRVIVIADNCTDDTAVTARAAGADVMVRHQPTARGKGHALRWAMDRVLGGLGAPDAIVVMDADSVADPDFLLELEAQLAAGHDVVQADDLILVQPGSARSALEAAKLLLHNRVRFAGRAALGMPAFLCGNGMAISRTVLEQYPWDAYSSIEDAEYSMTVRIAGVKTWYARRAIVQAQATSDEQSAFTQTLRWDGGRFFMQRRWLGPLLWQMIRFRRWDLFDTALEIAIPPLGLITIAASLGTSVTTLLVALGDVPAWVVVPWALALIGIPLEVLIGLRAAGAPPAVYRALLQTPRFLLRKLLIYRRLLAGVDLKQWVRSDRLAQGR